MSMWGNEHTRVLLAGMGMNAAPLVGHLAALINIQMHVPLTQHFHFQELLTDLSTHVLRHGCKKKNALQHLFVVTENWKQYKCPSLGDW